MEEDGGREERSKKKACVCECEYECEYECEREVILWKIRTLSVRRKMR